MFKKIWHWFKGGDASETDATPQQPVSLGSGLPTTDVVQDDTPKRKYTKKQVDNSSVYVADDVAADLAAKGVDVEKAVETTLKKSSPKPKKSKVKKVVKKSDLGYNKDFK